MATQIWEILPEKADGKDSRQTGMRIFEGTYTQYRLQQEAERATMVEARSIAIAPPQKARPERANPEERKRTARLKEVEAQIAELEGNLAALSRQLENPPADPARVQRLGGEYVRVQGEMDDLMGEWERLQ